MLSGRYSEKNTFMSETEDGIIDLSSPFFLGNHQKSSFFFRKSHGAPRTFSWCTTHHGMVHHAP
jgi:hypothetical protein